MKNLLLTTIAAVVLVGCEPKPNYSFDPSEPQPTEPSTAKAPDISIHEAAEDGNIEAVKQHIAAGTDLNAKNEVAFGVGETPLHWAAGEGRKKVAELLIANDVNASSGGMTPLHKAATRGEKEIVELLITAGADVNAKINGVATPLDWARIGRHTEISDLLRKHGGKTGEELKAVDKAIKPVAESAQPEPPTGKTPDASLWEAAMFGVIELANKVIADGADVNAKKEDGQTPLHSAVVAALDSGDNKVIELLIENGADVNAKIVSGRHQGMTPLDITGGLSEAASLNKRLRELQGKTDDIPVTDLLRKHGGKTGEELEAEGK